MMVELVVLPGSPCIIVSSITKVAVCVNNFKLLYSYKNIRESLTTISKFNMLLDRQRLKESKRIEKGNLTVFNSAIFLSVEGFAFSHSPAAQLRNKRYILLINSFLLLFKGIKKM